MIRPQPRGELLPASSITTVVLIGHYNPNTTVHNVHKFRWFRSSGALELCFGEIPVLDDRLQALLA